MKKLIHVATAAVCLVALAGVAGAAGARTDKGEYNTLTVETNEPGLVTAGHLSNGVIFKVKPGERFVTLEIDDQYADEVRAVVLQDWDGDNDPDLREEICTVTEAPIKIRPGVDLEVWTQEGLCEDDTPAMATVGTVTATFTK